MQKKKNSLWMALLPIVFMVIGLSIHFGSKKEVIQDDNVLIIGTNAEFPPFAFQENDSLKGLDIDVANEIARRLNRKIIFKDMPFDALLPQLQSGAIQVIAGGLSATPERRLKVFFTDPVFSGSPLVIVTLKDKPAFKTPQELVGKTVAVNEGYIADTYISNIPGITVYRMSTALVSEGILALTSGRADALVTALASLKPYLKNNKNIEIEPIPGTNEEDAFVVSQKYPELLDELQKTIQEMKQDGALDAIIEKWI